MSNKAEIKRGFAAMTPERRREIAQKGGLEAQRSGRGHRYNVDEARLYGRMGGLATSKDTKHMSKIGKLGSLRRKEQKNLWRNFTLR